MSYFDRLESYKQGLLSKVDEYQQLQDNIQQGAEDYLNAKVSDIAEKLEAVGGLGLGVIESGKAVKKLLNKWKGKKDEDEEEEDGEETPGTEGGETAPPGEDAPDAPAPAQGTTEAQRPVDNAEQGAEGAEDAEGPSENLESIADNLPEPGAEIEMQDLGTNAQLRQVNPDAENNISQDGMRETQAQEDIMNQDPEAGRAFNDDGPERVQPEEGEEAVAEGGEEIAETGVDVSTTVGSSLLDGALAIGDAVLDAIPVVGEVAMLATAIAGFFEGMFGHHHSAPVAPDEIIAQAGFDPSAVISQLPVSLQV